MNKYYNNEKEKLNDLKDIENEIKEKINSLPSDDKKISITSSKLFKYILLSIIIVLMITNIILTFINIGNKTNLIEIIINMSIITLFTIFYIITNLSLNKKNRKIYIIITTIILTIYYIFLILFNLNIFPNQKTIENFYNKDLNYVVKWADKNNIKVETLYEYSDNFEKYKVISQNINPGTLLKKVDKLIIVVSDGPNKNKQTVIPDMKEWTTDKVISYVEDNHLTNLSIEFNYNDAVEKDLVYEQSNTTGTITRDTEIKLKISLGKKENLTTVTMKDLKGMDLFHATTWLGRNAIKYEIAYGYSDEYEEGKVIKQSIAKDRIIDKERTRVVTITLATKNAITVPDLKAMKISDINIWASVNKIKINTREEYDDTIKKDYIISSSVEKGKTIEIDSTIDLIVSKGQIKMIDFNKLEEFTKWADENELQYSIEYEFSDKFKQGEIIETSYKKGEVIKNESIIIIKVSQGGTTTIPNFIGKNKTDAETLCKDNNIKCTFKEIESYKEKGTVLTQSMKAGSTVPTNTNIEIEISK